MSYFLVSAMLNMQFKQKSFKIITPIKNILCLI